MELVPQNTLLSCVCSFFIYESAFANSDIIEIKEEIVHLGFLLIFFFLKLLCFTFCSGCFVAASAYEDRLALFSLSMSADSDIIDKVLAIFVCLHLLEYVFIY